MALSAAEQKLRKPSPAEKRAMHDAVLARDGWRCRAPWCGSRNRLTVHHVIPRSRGGPWALWNLLTLCGDCHGDAQEYRIGVTTVFDTAGQRFEFRRVR